MNAVYYLLGQQERTLATIKMILRKEEGYISTASLALIRGLLDLPLAEIDPPPLETPAEKEENIF